MSGYVDGGQAGRMKRRECVLLVDGGQAEAVPIDRGSNSLILVRSLQESFSPRQTVLILYTILLK